MRDSWLFWMKTTPLCWLLRDLFWLVEGQFVVVGHVYKEVI